MTKEVFFLSLRDKLSVLSQKDMEEHLIFYSEMIDDRVEEGLSEEEAVAAVGSVEEIAHQILAAVPFEEEKTNKPKEYGKVWEIFLLILGSPLWLPLLIAGFAVAFSLYISLWAVIIFLWAVFISVAASAFALIVCGIGFPFGGFVLQGIAMLGAGLFCTGFSVFAFFGCKAVTKATVQMSGKCVHGVWNKWNGRKHHD